MARSGRPRKYDPIADNIRRAIKIFDNEKAQELILATDIDILDGYARTPLFHAVIENNIEILNWLIEKGANLNHQDREGFCALYFASLEKNIEAATTLLKNRASTELRDNDGNTPLWRAAYAAHQDYGIFKLLLEYGANLDNMNNYGRTIREQVMKMFPEDFKSILASLGKN